MQRAPRCFVEHAIGSLERPMTDADLEAKLRSLAEPVIGAERAGNLIAACWALGGAKSVADVAAAGRP